MSDINKDVVNKIAELYMTLLKHDGYGEMTVAMRILKRHQKEIVIKCGCEYRYVVDWKSAETKKNFEKNAQGVEAGSNVQSLKNSADCPDA